MSQIVGYSITILQQKNFHDVCRTTCHQPCMKPSWQSQPSSWCCLGAMPCAVLWREHHKAAPRSDSHLRRLADMHASTHAMALSPTGFLPNRTCRQETPLPMSTCFRQLITSVHVVRQMTRASSDTAPQISRSSTSSPASCTPHITTQHACAQCTLRVQRVLVQQWALVCNMR